MIAILRLTNVSHCVENLVNSYAISGGLCDVIDIFESQSHQPGLMRSSLV